MKTKRKSKWKEKYKDRMKLGISYFRNGYYTLSQIKKKLNIDPRTLKRYIKRSKEINSEFYIPKTLYESNVNNFKKYYKNIHFNIFNDNKIKRKSKWNTEYKNIMIASVVYYRKNIFNYVQIERYFGISARTVKRYIKLSKNPKSSFYLNQFDIDQIMDEIYFNNIMINNNNVNLISDDNLLTEDLLDADLLKPDLLDEDLL